MTAIDQKDSSLSHPDLRIVRAWCSRDFFVHQKTYCLCVLLTQKVLDGDPHYQVF